MWLWVKFLWLDLPWYRVEVGKVKEIKEKSVLSFFQIFGPPSFASLSRKRADGMGSELGPEHDHNMDQTSNQTKSFQHKIQQQQLLVRFNWISFSLQNILLSPPFPQIWLLSRRTWKAQAKSLTKAFPAVFSSGTCSRFVPQKYHCSWFVKYYAWGLQTKNIMLEVFT